MTSAFSWQNSISLCPASLWHRVTKKKKKKKEGSSEIPEGFSQRMPWSHSKTSGHGESREGKPGGENQIFQSFCSQLLCYWTLFILFHFIFLQVNCQ